VSPQFLLLKNVHGTCLESLRAGQAGRVWRGGGGGREMDEGKRGVGGRTGRGREAEVRGGRGEGREGAGRGEGRRRWEGRGGDGGERGGGGRAILSHTDSHRGDENPKRKKTSKYKTASPCWNLKTQLSFLWNCNAGLIETP